MDIDGQMTIFDYLNPTEEGTEELPALHEIVKKVNERFGINLASEFSSVFRMVIYKSYIKTRWGKTYVSVKDSEYTCEGREGKRFVGVYFNWGVSGSGYPCNTLEEVFEKFEFFMRSEDGNKRTNDNI